jgi:hypothetical protein
MLTVFGAGTGGGTLLDPAGQVPEEGGIGGVDEGGFVFWHIGNILPILVEHITSMIRCENEVGIISNVIYHLSL